MDTSFIDEIETIVSIPGVKYIIGAIISGTKISSGGGTKNIIKSTTGSQNKITKVKNIIAHHIGVEFFIGATVDIKEEVAIEEIIHTSIQIKCIIKKMGDKTKTIILGNIDIENDIIEYHVA